MSSVKERQRILDFVIFEETIKVFHVWSCLLHHWWCRFTIYNEFFEFKTKIYTEAVHEYNNDLYDMIKIKLIMAVILQNDLLIFNKI